MKRSRLILALTALPSLATFPYGRQWFLWSVGPLMFYWPLLPMSLVVLALSIAAFFSVRRWIRILFLAALAVQLCSLLVALVVEYPANGEPFTFSTTERITLMASDYLYLLGLLLLVQDRPWRPNSSEVTRD